MPLTQISKHIVFLVASAFLFACQANTLPPKGEAPCWMENLYVDNAKHLYGVAHTFSASHLPPEHFAKANAINNWLISEGNKPIEFEQDLSEQNQFQLSNKTLYFVDSYRYKSQVYALISDKKSTAGKHNCSIPKCELNKCQPGFLCDNSETDVTLFGISAPTAHPNDVIKHMMENAQQMARTMGHAKVMGEVFTLNINSQHVNSNTIQQKFNIKQLDKDLSPVKVKNMCHYNGTLISQIEFDKSSFGQDHPWLETPNYKDFDGSVGHAKGNVSTGRLSDLVNVAARRGLFELAKAKNIKVESDVELEVHSGGFYSLVRKSHQTTESIVSAFVADMKMELNGKMQPEVYVWLLENKGKL